MRAVSSSDRVWSEGLPFAPIYTVTRSGRPEMTIHGVIYLCAGSRMPGANTGRSLLCIGDTRFPLWSRSLLKPWQLMVIYPTLRAAYPALGDAHLALMAASHSGDARQIRLLEEILQLGDLSEQALRCPSCRAFHGEEGSAPRPLNHPCSGKHLGHLLYLRARKLPLQAYLSPENEPYQLLRLLLGYLLNRRDFDITTDGCGMPNLALNAMEMAQLYHALLMPVSEDIIDRAPDELRDILTCWQDVSVLVRHYPELVGGERRLDTRLMQGGWQTGSALPVVAKEGADGLLCIGIGANHVFADGLGFCIKLASGYDPGQLERIIFELLAQLGLHPQSGQHGNEVVRTWFHFRLESVSADA